MGAREEDVMDRPVIDSWRRGPSRAMVRYATDLCRTELPYGERVRTIATFPVLTGPEMSQLIDKLAAVRQRRLARLRGGRRPRR